jgi:hypothetical protein
MSLIVGPPGPKAIGLPPPVGVKVPTESLLRPETAVGSTVPERVMESVYPLTSSAMKRSTPVIVSVAPSPDLTMLPAPVWSIVASMEPSFNSSAS